MSISSALGIGASSLATQQRAMDVLAHNIANVNTPGYSRQRADLATLAPEQKAGFNFGRGATIASIRRQVDLSIQRSLGNSASQKQMWTQVTQGLSAIENVFGSLSATGLSASFDHFFASWQQLANSPQDSAQKINVSVATNELVTTLTNMHNQLRTEQVNIDQQIDQKIKAANLLIKQVASLNVQIVRQETNSSSAPANDLRDQREQALQNIAAILPIQRVLNPDGSLLVQTLGGDMLVQDNVAHQLSRGTTVTASGFLDVVLQSSPKVPLAGIAKGGAIGGMVDLRDNRYGAYLSTLDSVSKNLIFGSNKIYSNGSSTIRGTTVSAGQASLVSASTRSNTITSQQTVTASANALANSGVPLASKITVGSFKLVTYNSSGDQSGSATIKIKPTDSLDSVVAAINGSGLGVIASVLNGALQMKSTASGSSLAVTTDNSKFLEAFGIHSALLDTSGVPFANKITQGSFKIHLYDSAGKALNVGGLLIPINPATTTLDDPNFRAPPATTGIILGAGKSVIGGKDYTGSTLPTGNFAVGDILSGDVASGSTSNIVVFKMGTLKDSNGTPNGTNVSWRAGQTLKQAINTANTSATGTKISATSASYTIASIAIPVSTTGLVVKAGSITLKTPYAPGSLPSLGSFAANDLVSANMISAKQSPNKTIFPPGSLSDGSVKNKVAVTLPNDGKTSLAAAIAATTGVGVLSTTIANYTISTLTSGTLPTTNSTVLGAGSVTLNGITYRPTALPTGTFIAGDVLSGSLISAATSPAATIFPVGTLWDGTNLNTLAVTLPNDGSTTLAAAIAATKGTAGLSNQSTYTIATTGTPPATTGMIVGAGSITLGVVYPSSTLPTGNFSAGDTLSGTLTNVSTTTGAIVFPARTLSDGTYTNLVAVTWPSGTTSLSAAIHSTFNVGAISPVRSTIYTIKSSTSVVGLINQAVISYNNNNPTQTQLVLTASTSNGVLKLDTGSSKQTIGFSKDSSHFLAAYEINSLFHGSDTASLAVDSAVANDGTRINTGTIDSKSNIYVADNQTALAMFSLQQTSLSVDGTVATSLHQRNSDLSAKYGLDVASAQRQLTYRTAEFNSLTSQRDAVSGVNMDEELINMIKFQRAYQSSAKIITTVNQMLDSLMGLIR